MVGRSLPSASRSVPDMAHAAVHGDSQPAEMWPPWSKGHLEHLLCLSVLALEGSDIRGHPVYWEDPGTSTCLYPLYVPLASSDVWQ